MEQTAYGLLSLRISHFYLLDNFGHYQSLQARKQASLLELQPPQSTFSQHGSNGSVVGAVLEKSISCLRKM